VVLTADSIRAYRRRATAPVDDDSAVARTSRGGTVGADALL